MEVESPSDPLEKLERGSGTKPELDSTESASELLTRDVMGARPDPMAFDSWAARPAPRRSVLPSRDRFDLGALKIFLILAGLTAGMALALRSLF
jgi:hypothetical protein